MHRWSRKSANSQCARTGGGHGGLAESDFSRAMSVKLRVETSSRPNELNDNDIQTNPNVARFLARFSIKVTVARFWPDSMNHLYLEFHMRAFRS